MHKLVGEEQSRFSGETVVWKEPVEYTCLKPARQEEGTLKVKAPGWCVAICCKLCPDVYLDYLLVLFTFSMATLRPFDDLLRSRAPGLPVCHTLAAVARFNSEVEEGKKGNRYATKEQCLSTGRLLVLWLVVTEARPERGKKTLSTPSPKNRGKSKGKRGKGEEAWFTILNLSNKP